MTSRFLQKTATLALLLLTVLSCNPGRSGSPGKIFIDLDKLPAKQVDISEYLEDVFIVPLETTPNSLLGTLDISEQDDSGIFYLSYENQTIYRFSASGKFLNSFCHMGKGPGEYARVRNMHIIPGTRTILVSDVRQQKMLHYDYAGNLISEFRLPQSTGRFVVLNNNLIALHAGKMMGLEGKDTLRNDLLFLDMEGKIIGRKFPFSTPLYYEFSYAFTRPDADGTFHYAKQFDYNIYSVRDTGQPQVFLQLDYGKSMATVEDLKGPSMEDFLELQKEGKRLSTDNPINTYDQFAFINIKSVNTSEKIKVSLILIDKKTGNQTAFGTDSLFNLGNFNGLPILIPRDSYKTHFLFKMEAIDLYQTIQSLSADQINILKKKVKGFDRIQDIKQEDNPVLVYYRFRDF